MGRGYFIIHQIRKIHNLSLHPARNATQLRLTPTNITPSGKRGGGERKNLKKKTKKKHCQSPSSSRWAKLICKYIQEIKKQNYTGKWGSYTWIVRIMNNYCEFPAPNITCFLINKDLIIELRWRISAALINLAEKTSPRWPPVMKRACPESVCESEPRGTGRVTRRRPATVLCHTQEGHNFFYSLSKGLIYAGNTAISPILWGLGQGRQGGWVMQKGWRRFVGGWRGSVDALWKCHFCRCSLSTLPLSPLTVRSPLMRTWSLRCFGRV